MRRRPIKSKSYVFTTNNKHQEYISSKSNKNNLKMTLDIINKEENKRKTLSFLSSGKMNSYKILLKENKYRSDKVEKKLYLENINMRNNINIDLLSKLNNTFKSFSFQSNGNDPKIEKNLLNIGTKRSLLLRKSMTTVKNMIQDFDEQFSINFGIKNLSQKRKTMGNNLYNKNKLKQTKEESISDYDFNLNKSNNENNDIINNNDDNNYKINNKNDNNSENINKDNNNDEGNSNQLLNNNIKKFVKEMKKGKKYLKYEQNIKKKLKNEKKIIELKNCFKYYELLYNYKYFLTEKDILCLSFNRRKKMERKDFYKYLKTPRKTLDFFVEKPEKCKKCENKRKMDKNKYKNNLKIHLFNNFKIKKQNNNIKLFKTELNYNRENKEKYNKLNRALSGYNSNIIEKNKSYNNSNFKYNKTFSRPTSSSTNKLNIFNKKLNFNSLSLNEKGELNLSNISSISKNNSPKLIKNHEEKSNYKPPNILSIKNKIINISQNIKANSKKLKINLEDTHKNIMKKIEEERKPVKKVKKKMKIDIDKIRADLNLKRRGEGIDENKIIMDNVDKLYKSLPKTHVDLMRSIAKIVINEERRKNKPLIYNDTYDNNLFKARLKKEMFKASYKMKEIRKSLNKYKIEKPFEEQLRHLLKNDVPSFFNIKSLEDEINRIKAIKGEIITDYL